MCLKPKKIDFSEKEARAGGIEHGGSLLCYGDKKKHIAELIWISQSTLQCSCLCRHK